MAGGVAVSSQEKAKEVLVSHNIKIMTWNCRGLKQAERRAEIIRYLGGIACDIIVLQELNFKDERDRAAAQKQWTWGPSIWSYSAEGRGGVAILTRYRSELKVQRWIVGKAGHLLIMDFLLQPGRGGGGSGPPPPLPKGGTPFRLCAVYAPIQIKERQRLWARLKDFMEDTTRPLLIMGDFNNRAKVTDRIVRLMQKTRWEEGEDPFEEGEQGGREEKETSRQQQLTPPLTPEERNLQNYLERKGLQDLAWTIKNSLDFFPIHCKRTYMANFQLEEAKAKCTCYYYKGASRIDRIWTGPQWEAETCKIIITPWSDHGQLYMQLKTRVETDPREENTSLKRLQRWRLDSASLKQQEYKDTIELTIRMWEMRKEWRKTDPIGWWEKLKPKVAQRCRELNARVYRKQMATYHQAVAGFLNAHIRLNEGKPWDEGRVRRYENIIESYLKEKRERRKRKERCRTQGPLLLKEDWEKQKLGRRPQRNLDGLRDGPGLEPDRTVSGMIEKVQRHFGELFGGKPLREEDIRSWVAKVQRKVEPTEEEEKQLIQPIEEWEVRRAIQQGREGAAPGPDGLTYAFYKTFVGLVTPHLTDAFNAALEKKGEFSGEFFGGYLNLIYKDVGDPYSLSNWRPINVSNVDYRIWAKVLHNRLATWAPCLISEGQTSAVPGRQMAESHRVTREVFTMVRRGEWGGQMVQMDQSKAFDRVHRPYLWATMEKKGVPAKFIEWLKTIYEKANVTPIINGYMGQPIRHGQGLRQGCPLSPLLYVLALDPLLERVAKEPRLEGVPFGTGQDQEDHKIAYVAHADDATFFLNSRAEMQILKDLTQEYAKASGAAINLDKSQVFYLPRGSRETMRRGNWSEKEKECQGTSEKKSVEEESEKGVDHVRLLGVYFSLKDGEWRENWRKWQDRVRYQLERWKKWHLTLYQRAKYINTYCMPTATFLAMTYPPPKEMMERMVGELFDFLWGTKFFPLARVEAYRRVEEGGLGLRALAPWLLAQFLSTNFRGWWRAVEEGPDNPDGEERRKKATWQAFGNTWVMSHWAQRWWWAEEADSTPRPKFRLTAAMKAELPEYLAEAAVWVKELRIGPEACKQKEDARRRVQEEEQGRDTKCNEGGKKEKDINTCSKWFLLKETADRDVAEERKTRSHIYELVVSAWQEQTILHRQAKSATLSKYRLTNEAACQVFADKTIPFSLWEVRWRAFHQVIRVGATQPWLGRDQRRCKRPECLAEPGGPPEETIAHYVKQCPAAIRLWEAVAAKLRWPELKDQEWETIVSGMQPQGRTHPGTALATRNRQYGPVPWQVVRLTNLYVLQAIGLHKAKELRTERSRQEPAGPWADYVHARLCNCALWEREHGKRNNDRGGGKEQWHRRWEWLGLFPTPIT